MGISWAAKWLSLTQESIQECVGWAHRTETITPRSLLLFSNHLNEPRGGLHKGNPAALALDSVAKDTGMCRYYIPRSPPESVATISLVVEGTNWNTKHIHGVFMFVLQHTRSGRGSRDLALRM